MEQWMIRRETPDDYESVENLIREAFWNQYVPGCDEHYLAHIMRSHADFIPELDLVAEMQGKIVGSILYTKARLRDAAGYEKEILTFGPLSVHPDFQRRGISKALMAHSFETARALGYDMIVIFGDPDNYVSSGFKSCLKYNICLEGDHFPFAMLGKELIPGALDGRRWYYHESPAYEIDAEDARAFDRKFAPKKPEYQPSQEIFFIHRHASLRAE